MALIKCKECGHEVSDKASTCPNCGCPIEKGLICNECGNSVSPSDEECPNCGCPIGKMASNQVETAVTEKKKKGKSLLWLSVVLIACLIGGGLFYAFKNGYILNKEISAIGVNDAIESCIKGQYAVILYNDNVGDFYNPKGGRICSFRLTDGRQEPLTLKLSQSISIMGTSTNRLYVTSDRLFAEHMDYVRYSSSYNPDKSLGVAVEKKETDDGTCFIVALSSSMIEQKETPIHQIKVSKDIDYTMLYYNDEYGTLYDSKGLRLCGVSKGVTIVGDLCVKLSKPISVYGVTTSELSIKGDNLYTSDHDLIDDRYKNDDEPSKKVAMVKRTDDKDATIYAFSKASEQRDDEKSNVNQQANSSEWNISSVEELQKKIVGTVWTCRPTGRTWYRLVFTENDMKLYFAQPSQGKWNEAQSNKWRWNATQSYTSDTGEKCYTIQFKKPDDELSYGALLFFKDGEIQFNWLRGREGGKAECKDFNWE